MATRAMGSGTGRARDMGPGQDAKAAEKKPRALARAPVTSPEAVKAAAKRAEKAVAKRTAEAPGIRGDELSAHLKAVDAAVVTTPDPSSEEEGRTAPVDGVTEPVFAHDGGVMGELLSATPRMIALSKLVVAPGNVRRGGKAELDQLAADIAAHGLLQNLTGVVQADGMVAIVAGGRRLREMQMLAKRGTWGKDHAVPVKIVPADSGAELGLAENVQRLALPPIDEARAYAAVIAGGADAEGVAQRFGVTVRHVRQRLRLANLAEPVAAALAKGKITLDVAQVFAGVEDQALQAKVFADCGNYDLSHPAGVRAKLQNACYQGGDGHAIYVGRDAYLAAGGRIEADLFADEASEYWVDWELVDRLAGEKLATEAAEWRERFGFARVIPYLLWSDLDDTVKDLSKVDWRERGDWTQKPEGVRSQLVIGLRISHEGRAEPGSEAWLASGDMLHGTAPPPPPPSCAARDDDDDDAPASAGSAAEEKPKCIPQSLKDALAMRRRDALGASLLAHPELARDYLAFILIEGLCGRGGQSLGVKILVDRQHREPVQPGKDGLPWAAEHWTATHAVGMTVMAKAEWRKPETVAERWAAFRALDALARELTLAVAVAASLTTYGEFQRQPELHRLLAAAIAGDGNGGIDIAAKWRPTADNYFTRAGKAGCLAFLVDCLGPGQSADAWKGWKLADLAAACEALAAGDAAKLGGLGGVPAAEIEARGKAWLPEQMIFAA